MLRARRLPPAVLPASTEIDNALFVRLMQRVVANELAMLCLLSRRMVVHLHRRQLGCTVYVCN